MLEKFTAFQKAQRIYEKCKVLRLPDHLEHQLRRASASIALNLAEGWGKKLNRDREKYFTNALGSLRECQAVLALECREEKELAREMDELGAIIYTLTHKPRKSR